MLSSMSRTLQNISAFFFYLLGTSFIVGWVLIKSNLYRTEAATWMQVADLPLIFCALVYGAASLYRSLRHPDTPSTLLAWTITIVFTALFGLVLVMNFWGAV